MSGLVVDNFAGGGGASTGIEQALGRAVDIAINHDEQAVRMHEANHPGTRHIRNNIWQVDPVDVCGGRPVELAWFSPDCKHFSKAKGGKPREKSIRDLAWVVVRWAKQVRPALILLENVEEFRTWGPLDLEGQPIKERAGETFDLWCRELRRHGYKLQFRELRACDYGAPTIRKRFFMVARCDGLPIVWPEPTHGKPDSPEVLAGKRLPWRTAAEIIDWSIPCPSIFERKKPLAEATCRRIARGIVRYVLENPKPFIVPNNTNNAPKGADEPLPTVTTGNRNFVVVPHITKFRNGATGHSIDEPLATVTANSFIKRPGGSGPLGVVAANLVHIGNGEREGQAPRAMDAEMPLGTVVAGGAKHALVTAFLAQYNNDRGVSEHPGKPLDAPLSVVTTKGPHQALVTSNLVKLRGTCADGQAVDEPLHTVSAGGSHFAEVRAFLLKYYGAEQDPRLDEPLHTVTSRDRFGLVIVTVEGEEYAIVDIGMRMLTKREQFNAQGFPPDYIIDRDAHGAPITGTAQQAKCGNSVCPPIARALVAANAPSAADVTAEAARRGLSLQKTSLSVFGSKAGIYSLRGDGTVRRKTADKIRAWIADAPSDDQLLPPVQAEPERPPPSVPPAPASEPSVVQVPSGVRKLRPYCRQPDTCVAPSRGPCRICHADAVNAGVKRRITHQAEALLAGDSDGKTSGGSVHPAVRAAANNIDATRRAQARQIEPVEQAKLALQRKGRTVYDASVCGGKKGHFHVSGKRDANGRLLELTPAALLDEAERVTGQSFRRAPA